jgi:hypothetical protein
VSCVAPSIPLSVAVKSALGMNGRLVNVRLDPSSARNHTRQTKIFSIASYVQLEIRLFLELIKEIIADANMIYNSLLDTYLTVCGNEMLSS